MSAIDLERMEALLRGDAPRTPAEERRSALLGELRGARLAAPEALRARVLATPRAPSRRPSWRLGLVVVPAALVLALAAALVHGFRHSGARPAASDSAQALKAPAAGTAPAAGARLAHTDASLTLRVAGDELAQKTDTATRLATSLGGFAESVVSRSPAEGPAESYLELRVPTHTVRRALAQLGELGTIVSQEVSVQDLQHELAVQSEQIAQLRRRVAALEEALSGPALPEAQRVLLRIRLAETQRALAQRVNARKGTIAAGRTSRISLVLTTQGDAAAAGQGSRLERVLRSAVDFLALEATVALYVLIVISPLAAVGAAAWWIAALRRRRDAQRLLLME